MRIILDKSVVRGLSNNEVDALDRYFFQIIPPILQNEILADLTKLNQDVAIENKIAGQSYRIAGNGGIAEGCRALLGNSLMGNEVPMDGRFVPSHQHIVRTGDNRYGTIIDTREVEEKIARWERKEFIGGEREAITSWRQALSRPVNVKMYTDKIQAAGLIIDVPETDEELTLIVDDVVQDSRMQGTLLYLLFREWSMPYEFQKKVLVRWGETKRPPLAEFAPYAAYCVRVELMWALGLSNPQLFKADTNDRKDIQYCYYLPHTEIFASNDKKHLRIAPLLIRDHQSIIDGATLKKELAELSARWDGMTREEQIELRYERADAPPENLDSVIYQLWLKHRGELRKNLLGLEKAMVVDSRLPEDQQAPVRFGDIVKELHDKFMAGTAIGPRELDQLQADHAGADPTSFAMRRRLISKERVLKQYPELTNADLASSK